MSINLDKYFGIHAQALQFRSQRNEVLASNIANADTPGYRARDLDFSAALQAAQGQAASGDRMQVTHASHMGGSHGAGGAQKIYRNSLQPSQDGNTVDTQVEKAEFARNSIQYQASLEFLNGRIRSLVAAIKGGSTP
ncbi:flagellar basal body rod protein FlgB [Wenzhouxiangella sp. AB-CW3]|uniref:flagellar basal body rod protein FlgB n=1 Tax=Wenzhouxiangella sp. AB-CW3 TaxID=2771012 RepID=UPI00168AAF8C|nr:flagellar basal body rod protein FlgB [Wenzhouxiangella sp. AB-CW3]QOC21229.1 flagellar basal body rod protein FlgB [Wenzhouxiangella sp. AB-CW3]